MLHSGYQPTAVGKIRGHSLAGTAKLDLETESKVAGPKLILITQIYQVLLSLLTRKIPSSDKRSSYQYNRRNSSDSINALTLILLMIVLGWSRILVAACHCIWDLILTWFQQCTSRTHLQLPENSAGTSSGSWKGKRNILHWWKRLKFRCNCRKGAVQEQDLKGLLSVYGNFPVKRSVNKAVLLPFLRLILLRIVRIHSPTIKSVLYLHWFF